MFQIIVFIIVFVGGISYATYSALEVTDSKMMDYRIAKSIISIDNKRVVQSQGTPNPIENSLNLQDIRQSNLILDQLSLNEQVLINKLQDAVKIAMIDNNITSPTCADLASTGLITTVECTQIKDKQQNYLSIKEGVMNVDNEKINKIIHANITQTRQADNNGSILQEDVFLKTNAKATAENQNHAKQILEIIKQQNTKEEIIATLNNIDTIAKTQPIIAKEILYTARKKLEVLPNADDAKTLIDSAILIAEEKIEALKTITVDTTKTLSSAKKEMEGSATLPSKIWETQNITTFTK